MHHRSMFATFFHALRRIGGHPAAILTGIAALLIATPATVRAGDASEARLRELMSRPVFGASKRLQGQNEAPAMVRIIHAEEFRDHGWRTLGEALASLPGIHASNDRSYTTLSHRGFGRPGDYNSRVLLLIDGVPYNDGAYDQAAVGAELPIDIELIDRVEYIPGPASSLYGGNAILAVVNLITQSGARHGTRIELGLGSAGMRGLRAARGQRADTGEDWLIAVSTQRSDGRDLHFESYALPGANAWSRDLDHESTERIFVRHQRGGLLATLLAGERVKGVPGGPYGADLDDPRNRHVDRHLRLNLAYEQHLDSDHKLDLHAFLLDYAYRGDWSYAGTLFTDRLENRAWGVEARLNGTARQHHAWLIGVGWRDDGRRRQFNTGLDVDTPRRALALFAQDEWRVAEALTLSYGARYDRIDARRTHTRISPRLAAIATLAPATTLKVTARRAFRLPNAFESDYAFPGTNLANPALRPETVAGLEAGIEHATARGLLLSGTLYADHIDDMIVMETDPGGLQIHRNVDRVTLRGLELTAGKQGGELRWRASLSLQRANHAASGAPLANAPRVLARLTASTALGNARAGMEIDAVGPRHTESGDITRPGPRVGGHALVHLNLHGAAPFGQRGLEWQVRVANLFDRRHASVVGTEFSAAFPGVQAAPMPTMTQDGRMLYGSLRWSF